MSVRDALKLEKVASRDGPAREQLPGAHRPLVQQFAQLVEIASLVGPDTSGYRRYTPQQVGFSPRWTSMVRYLWILVFAAHPDSAAELFRDQAETLTDDGLRQIFLERLDALVRAQLSS